MLERIKKECEDFLADWQAGFRSARRFRDNILLMRVLFEQAIISQNPHYVTYRNPYIDYSVAFDTVSHKLLDRNLAKTGASSSQDPRDLAFAPYTPRPREQLGYVDYTGIWWVSIQWIVWSAVFFVLG